MSSPEPKDQPRDQDDKTSTSPETPESMSEADVANGESDALDDSDGSGQSAR